MTPSLATSVAVSPSFAPTSCLPALLETYGEVMTPEQIAVELEYSAGYVRKKIGCAKYQHLPWVMSIAPHRRRQGLVWVYATCGVAAFLESQRTSLEPDSGFSKNLPRLLEAYGKAMTVEQVAKALGYRLNYVSKKIGNASYQHLPWVTAIARHRRKRGARWVYATEAVALYLDRVE
ncbi:MULTISPECIES: hypothetical protein [unclassified Pseudomonas]|uniref:hypothetical protein n=1 Tax=unclassified Pseudomonas TaxID=196821 RepID=UPI00131ECF0E|nr:MULTISPECIES: hypothetical protein [unclassified Pseudomonas]